MYKVSVIMPIYNGEKYLRNSLNSIIDQTLDFKNIELILVDDKSEDDTKTILEEYSKLYSNIKAIFLDENSGCPGIPRNVGIRNATADYIMFIDDDDEYLPEMCDKMYNSIISKDADIVVCNCLWTDNNVNLINTPVSSEEVIVGGETIYFDNCAVWNSIFKKSIILDNGIFFIDEDGEDGLFMLEYYIHSKKIIYLKDFVGCHHFVREDSISLMGVDWAVMVIKSYDKYVKLLEGYDCDLNRIFEPKVPYVIFGAMSLGNKDEIKVIFSTLADFEKKINFTGKLPLVYQFINFFILRGNLNMAAYICLFIFMFRKSDLIINIYRKFFHSFFKKFF